MVVIYFGRWVLDFLTTVLVYNSSSASLSNRTNIKIDEKKLSLVLYEQVRAVL